MSWGYIALALLGVGMIGVFYFIAMAFVRRGVDEEQVEACCEGALEGSLDPFVRDLNKGALK